MRVILIFVFFFLISCQDQTIPNTTESIENTDLKWISFELLTGWCGHGNELYVGFENNTIKLTTFNSCHPDEILTTSTRDLSEDENDKLEDLIFNNDEFWDLNLNNCGVCYDGSEEILSILTTEDYNSILFDARSVSELSSTQELLEELDLLKSSF